MTYLENNMNLLKTISPETWEKMSTVIATPDQNRIQLVPNKKGELNLQAGRIFLHDEKNPRQEAKSYIEKQQGVEEHSDILFYGIGLGYHLLAFVNQYPRISFSIYEPVPEIFCQFLSHTDLTQIPRHLIKTIYVETHPADAAKFCGKYVKTIGRSGMVIELPAYQKIFPQKRKAFFTEFEHHVQERSVSVNTLSAFEKRWTLNSVKNFTAILKSPNILLEKKDTFINKPAILIASGPSLEDEIENLRRIKQEGLAYLFSVGTALNTLIQHELHPHAACTYDPTEKNQIICKEVLEKGIHTIPLIFGSTVGYETLETYPGPKMHMLISQDTLAAFYLKPANTEINETIHDATTIAVITLQLLARLKFSPIILVGQNLAYRDKKIYASGATFHPVTAAQPVLDNAVPVKDVYGSLVPSSPAFNRMRQQFEFYLSHHKDLRVINTTKFGAQIEGTHFQNLEDVIKETLQTRVVDEDSLSCSRYSYDLEHLMKQRQIMLTAFDSVLPLLKNCLDHLDIISELAGCRDPVRINQSYEQFNHCMDELRNNPFFSTYITPMNRVELEFLMLAVPAISAEREPFTKAQMMEDEFRPYLKHCEEDINSVSPLFQSMNHAIQRIYIQQKALHIRALLIDADGILTDGRVYFSSSGETCKQFHYKDRAGILRLQNHGITTLLITQDDAVLEHAAKKLGIEAVYSERNKKAFIYHVLKNKGYYPSEIACLFNDDEFDMPQVGLRFAVKDASRELQNTADYVLEVNGGQGVLQALADLITSA